MLRGGGVVMTSVMIPDQEDVDGNVIVSVIVSIIVSVVVSGIVSVIVSVVKLQELPLDVGG